MAKIKAALKRGRYSNQNDKSPSNSGKSKLSSSTNPDSDDEIDFENIFRHQSKAAKKNNGESKAIKSTAKAATRKRKKATKKKPQKLKISDLLKEDNDNEITSQLQKFEAKKPCSKPAEKPPKDTGFA